jgi:Zn-dependent protease
MDFDLTTVLLALPVLLLSLTAHEFAHAWVALKQGDDTAYMLGRVSMNPMAHLDWIGTILFPAIAIGTGAPLLGWAQPVPTTPRKFRNFKRGTILVALAGVCANAILAVVFAILCAIIARVAQAQGGLPEFVQSFFTMCLYGVMGNVGLILFNLLPIPPLDGHHVMYLMLPPHLAQQYRALYPYGMFILWALVLTGAVRFLSPFIRAISNVLLLPSGYSI